MWTFFLTVLASARLSRFVITDSLGQWLIQEPIDEAMDKYAETHDTEPWWWKYRVGLECQFCVGFWISLIIIMTKYIVPDKLWNTMVMALSANYVASHLGANLGDFDNE